VAKNKFTNVLLSANHRQQLNNKIMIVMQFNSCVYASFIKSVCFELISSAVCHVCDCILTRVTQITTATLRLVFLLAQTYL